MQTVNPAKSKRHARAAPRPADDTGTAARKTAKFVNVAQVGGIESYVLADGPGRGVRVLCVNTGGGLRYRLLVDRGMDIDHAFFHQYSLAFLTHKEVTAPTGGLERGIDWLKTFPGGLLTSCGPFNVGAPCTDCGEELGLHGPHSNTPATIESIVQPDPHAGRDTMSVTGVLRYGRLFGPCLTLRRTVTSSLGANTIDFVDDFFNAGNQPVPHAWLLHINFGYPLVDEGAELCYDGNVTPLDNPIARERFQPDGRSKRVPGPLDSHRGSTEAVAYIDPRPIDRSGRTTIGLVNSRLALGVAVDYSTREFPRCVNWQHWGPGEYVTALEPTNGSVEGRAKDRAESTLDFIPPGGSKSYRYSIRVVVGRVPLAGLRALNRRRDRANRM